MVNTYILVNPHIEGNFKTKVKAQNSQEAANNLYKSLSEHFNNSIPSFNFTIQKGSSGNGSLYHFQVKESRKKNEVSFYIKPMTIKGSDTLEEQFKSRLEKVKEKLSQDGGKKSKKSKKSKHDSSDSDSDSDFSSSSDNKKRSKSYIPFNQPISYWWYDPYVYRLDNLYVPSFYSYTIPQTIEYAVIL